MRRIAFLLCVLNAWFLAAAGTFDTHLSAAEKRPNIIFFLTDDQRWDTLGCMGNPIIQTPNLDRLGTQGVVFENCFVTTSICMTNRACIFTGQWAARHGIWDFRTSFTPEQLRETYMARLKQAGYYIGFIGKWGVGQPPKDFLDYNRAWPGQNRYLHVVDGQVRHLTNIMCEQALEFLDTVPKDKPFCLQLSFKAPHCQDGPPDRTLSKEPFKGLYKEYPSQFFYDPALADLYADVKFPLPPLSDPEFFDSLPDFLKQSENRVRWQIRFATPELYQHTMRAYYRLITGVDRAVGRILEKLRQEGFDENTIIVFSGDNGFYLGERGFAGKWLAHEVSIRVPLIIYDPRWPENLRGQRRKEMALSVDIPATILDLANVPPPPRMQGRSLLPLIEGRPVNWRTEFYYEHLFAHPRIPKTEAVRTERFKYIRYLDVTPSYEELYDLQNDPHEAHNLASDPRYAALLQQMRAKLELLKKRVQ